MRNGLFSEATLQKIQKARKVFLKSAVWILIAELVFWAILILMEGWSVTSGKVQGTFLILAFILFLGVNNFVRIEKGDETTQVFALVSFISNLFWGILAFLLMWDIVPGYYYSAGPHMTFFMKAMLVAIYASAGGFWISNILPIKETIKSVKPLKITAFICIAYLWIFATIVTLIEPKSEAVGKLYQLSGLAGLAFVTTALAAVMISKANDKKVVAKKGDSAQSAPKTEAELRAEIEERVRREMIEKEVRTKLESEQKMNSTAEAPEQSAEDAKQN